MEPAATETPEAQDPATDPTSAETAPPATFQPKAVTPTSEINSPVTTPTNARADLSRKFSLECNQLYKINATEGFVFSENEARMEECLGVDCSEYAY